MIYVEVRVGNDTQYLTRIQDEKDLESLNLFIITELQKMKQEEERSRDNENITYKVTFK